MIDFLLTSFYPKQQKGSRQLSRSEQIIMVADQKRQIRQIPTHVRSKTSQNFMSHNENSQLMPFDKTANTLTDKNFFDKNRRAATSNSNTRGKSSNSNYNDRGQQSSFRTLLQSDSSRKRHLRSNSETGNFQTFIQGKYDHKSNYRICRDDKQKLMKSGILIPMDPKDIQRLQEEEHQKEIRQAHVEFHKEMTKKMIYKSSKIQERQQILKDVQNSINDTSKWSEADKKDNNKLTRSKNDNKNKKEKEIFTTKLHGHEQNSHQILQDIYNTPYSRTMLLNVNNNTQQNNNSDQQRLNQTHQGSFNGYQSYQNQSIQEQINDDDNNDEQSRDSDESSSYYDGQSQEQGENQILDNAEINQHNQEDSDEDNINNVQTRFKNSTFQKRNPIEFYYSSNASNMKDYDQDRQRSISSPIKMRAQDPVIGRKTKYNQTNQKHIMNHQKKLNDLNKIQLNPRSIIILQQQNNQRIKTPYYNGEEEEQQQQNNYNNNRTIFPNKKYRKYFPQTSQPQTFNQKQSLNSYIDRLDLHNIKSNRTSQYDNNSKIIKNIKNQIIQQF